MSIHAGRFTGRAEQYQRFRQRFPAKVMQVLRARCGLRAGDPVADVGAGTGMLTEVLLRAGCEVTAVEPNAEMRAVCEHWLGADERLRVVDATAEATGLPERSQAMVTAGRAFHWFDRDRAVAEFERVLKPGGWLVLLWLGRARTANEMTRGYEHLLQEFGRDYDVCQSTRRSYDGPPPFGAGEHFEEVLGGEQDLTLEEFLGQTESYSVTPLPGDAKYAVMQGALREFFARWSEDGVLRLETQCGIQGWRTGI